MNNTILNTERLRLEIIGEQHKSDLYKLLANKEVHKFFPKALDKKEADEFYEIVQKRYDTDGYSFWAVIRSEDNMFLGICGLLSQTIDGIKETEVAYRFSDEFWGHGYATEAANGCIQYSKKELKLPSLISLIRSVNLPSIKVAERNGLKLEKETIFHSIPHLVYRIYLDEV